MPITSLELVVVLLALAFLFGAYRVIRAVKPFIVNAVIGLLALLVLGWLGLGVQITPAVVLVVAIGGIPGAILVVLLAYLGIVFAPAVAI